MPLSVGLKLARAREHLAGLDAEIRAYCESGAAGLRFDETCNQARLLFVLNAPPPPRLSILVGDVVHNARSAIDHLAWALVRFNRRTPSRKCSFPICDDEDAFNERGVKIIAGVGRRAESIIRGLQPYQLKADAHGHPLWLLQYLSNADKHRQLNAIGGYAMNQWVNLVERIEGSTLGGPLACFPDQVNSCVLNHGDEVATFPMSRDEALRRQLDVQVDGASFVAFDEAEEWRHRAVTTLLSVTLAYISEHVIAGLEPLFDGVRGEGA